MKKYAIIVAGGEGTRMGGGLPKQFRDLCGLPVVVWSMLAFHKEDSDTGIILVVNPRFMETWDEMFRALPENARVPHAVIGGGDSRSASVRNGLDLTENGDDVFVAVHDAARPLITPGMIRRGWEAAKATGSAVPGVPVTDSLRIIEDGSNRAVDRSRYVAVQTPQVFKADVLKKAYAENPGKAFSDDASACEAAGVATVIFEGDYSNIKITNPGDLDTASNILNHRDV